MIAHSIWWTLYATAAGGTARRVGRDWKDPDADRRVTLILAGIFAVIYTGIGVAIAVFA